jgi:hypothetical protein
MAARSRQRRPEEVKDLLGQCLLRVGRLVARTLGGFAGAPSVGALSVN